MLEWSSWVRQSSAFRSARTTTLDGSICRFRFIDDGEPGTSDRAYIEIWEPGDDPDTDTPVLSVGGLLTHGNVQAHYDQPHDSNFNR